MAAVLENWTDTVTTTDERKVFEALADQRWDFRTIDGLTKASGLPRSRVIEIVKKYDRNLIRRFSIPDAQGRDLYTLSIKHPGFSEALAKLRTFLSKSVP